MTTEEIKKILLKRAPYQNIFIPEFTWNDLRIDAIIIDLRHRWIRGFEIKTRREDFQRDSKWPLYTKFLSSLSIVCPSGLIRLEEVERPFGLLWVYEDKKLIWERRPRNFQRRASMAWFWTYLSVLEKEFPRMQYALQEQLAMMERGLK